MKQYTMGALLLITLTMGACSKIRDAIFPTIEVDLSAFQFTVPAFPVVLPNEASLGSFSMNFNLDSIIRANTAGAFGAGAVSSLTVKKMVISITNADANNDLSNFETARFVLSSDAETAPAEIINVSFADTPAQSKTVEPASHPELKPYLLGKELTYTLFGKARRPTTKPLNFSIALTLNAK